MCKAPAQNTDCIRGRKVYETVEGRLPHFGRAVP